jgi:hypothetical protein
MKVEVGLKFKGTHLEPSLLILVQSKPKFWREAELKHIQGTEDGRGQWCMDSKCLLPFFDVEFT